MAKLGVIIHKIPKSNIFIVNIGWGQLLYFSSNDSYKEKDIILYESWGSLKLYWSRFESKDNECTYDGNKIDVVYSLNDCEILGNIRFGISKPDKSAKSDIVIARKDKFIYWKGNKTKEGIDYGRAYEFDLVSNSLLFLSYAEPRHPYPDEKKWLEAYTYARKKVEELDILQMINELKVEYLNKSWTRRGSDNVIINYKRFEYGYSYHYSYLNDYYLENIFPKYREDLYSGEDDKCTYIHPKYEKYKVIKNDGYNEITEAKFDGLEIDTYCTQKTNELRQVALKNYESYNKNEHINYLAYRQINWRSINEENEFIQEMKGLGKLIWGYNHSKLLNQITKENYKELIQNNNTNHPTPKLSDD